MRRDRDRDEGRVKATFILFAFVILALSLNEAVYDFVVANSVYETSQAATYVGLTFLIAYLAEISTSFFLSGFADHRSRLRLFAGLQVLLLLAFLGTATIIVWAPERLTLLWTLTFAFDALNHLARLFMFAVIPMLFSGRDLWRANGVMAIGAGLSRALGPIAVGVIGFGRGDTLLLAILIACVLVSALITLSLHQSVQSADGIPSSTRDKEGGFRALGRTFGATSLILQQPAWRGFALSYAALMTLFVVSPLLWIPAFSAWHGFAPSQTAVAFSAFTLGTVAGGIPVFFDLPVLRRPRTLMALVYCGLTAGLCLTVFSTPPALLVDAGAAAFGAAASLYVRAAGAQFQAVVPSSLIGSWNGAIDTLSRILGMGCVLGLGLALDAWPVPLAYAALVLACGGALAFGRWHALPPTETAPEGTPSIAPRGDLPCPAFTKTR